MPAQKSTNATATSLASERATDALRHEILSGGLRPGRRVKQETLAAKYGISRIPIREALRQLESEGLVVLVPNSGAWIAKLDQSECVEIYKIREQLEPLAIAESAKNISTEAIADLVDLTSKIEASENPEDFLRLDRDFHLLSYSGSQMPRLLEMIYKFWNTTQHYRRAFAYAAEQSSMVAVHQEHALIAEAMSRQDGEQAARILCGHIRRTRLKLEEHDELFS